MPRSFRRNSTVTGWMKFVISVTMSRLKTACFINYRPRYTRRHRADPRGAVLLLHGMSDSPYSLRALGEALYQQDLHILGLRLPGHGTAPSGLLDVKWQDMAAAVRLAMAHLQGAVGATSVHIIGYSTGAPLALDFTLTAEQDDTLALPASLVLISPAIGVSPAAALATWKRRLSYLPGLAHLAWLDMRYSRNDNRMSRRRSNRQTCQKPAGAAATDPGAQIHSGRNGIQQRRRRSTAEPPQPGAPRVRALRYQPARR